MREYFKKRYFAIGVIPLLLMLAIGCSKKENVNISVKELANSITDKLIKDAKIGSKDELNWNEVDLLTDNASPILEKIDVDGSALEEGVLLEDSVASSANRILILKVKKEKDVHKVKKTLDKLRKNQEKSYKDGVKEEYTKVKDGLVAVRDNYIYYFVYDDVASLKKIVDDTLVK